MRRSIMKELNCWKTDENKKPLLINGIRQVGKTWIVKNFGENNFETMIYINFDIEPSYCDVFKKSKDPEKIIFELSLIFHHTIDIKNTLFFFDEIQECNEALNSLKYFYESDSNYNVIGAGSYLGITLSKGSSFPVGKVDIIEMKPMTYKEFLLANGEDMLVEYIENYNEKSSITEPIFQKMMLYFREYYIVGGMPEAVSKWVQEKSIEFVEKVQINILNSYQRDFAKYPERRIMPKIIDVWESVVKQLSRENKKFKYSEINKSARAREYEEALNWLIAGNYIKKVSRVSKSLIPLKIYSDERNFKIYFADTGLLRAKAQYPASAFSEINDNRNFQFKGVLAENVVLQELEYISTNSIYSWATVNNEIDFIIQVDQKIYPIEVKYGSNIHSKSLTKFLKENPETIGIRYSMKNLSFDGRILNIPFSMIGETIRLIQIFT